MWMTEPRIMKFHIILIWKQRKRTEQLFYSCPVLCSTKSNATASLDEHTVVSYFVAVSSFFFSLYFKNIFFHDIISFLLYDTHTSAHRGLLSCNCEKPHGDIELYKSLVLHLLAITCGLVGYIFNEKYPIIYLESSFAARIASNVLIAEHIYSKNLSDIRGMKNKTITY